MDDVKRTKEVRERLQSIILRMKDLNARYEKLKVSGIE